MSGKPYWIVETFTREPFHGNPAAVVFLSGTAWPSADWMTRVAAEFNLSETAFLLEPRLDMARGLRWFTPKVEISLCGHATLGSAHALWSSGGLKMGEPALFDTLSGRLSCALRSDGRIAMDFPACPVAPCSMEPALARAIGVSGTSPAARDGQYLFLELADEAAVRAVEPDFGALALCDADGVCVTARATEGRDYDFVSRFFAPKKGIPEDPVTGSAHCRLAPYWAPRLGRSVLTGLQVSARGGRVGVEWKGDRVLLVGQAVTVARGTLEL